MNKNKRKIYAGVAAGLLLLFWNPYTRAVLLWLLPLGSGYDDLLFVLAAIVAIAVYVTKAIKAHKEVIQEQIKDNWLWFVVGVVVFALVVIVFLQIYPIY
jgi:Na+/serine symporter